jgi:SAM-dependent methyltransferase
MIETRHQRRNGSEAERTVLRSMLQENANIAFHEGFIETADAIPDESVDLVISDCVINLSPAKEEVFRTIWRVLKPGGEMYISDIAADRRVPQSIRSDPRLVAECLGGAEYEHDWFDTMRAAAFMDPRVVSRSVVQEEARGEPILFSSLTVRAFKLHDMDRRCEDYGQLAIYRGSLPQVPARFVLDDHHVFEAQRPAPVCRNTARMLSETRLGMHFEVSRPIRHFGLFDCGATASEAPSTAGSCC